MWLLGILGKQTREIVLNKAANVYKKLKVVKKYQYGINVHRFKGGIIFETYAETNGNQSNIHCTVQVDGMLFKW